MSEKHIAISGTIILSLVVIAIVLSTWNNTPAGQDSTLSYHISGIPIELYISSGDIETYKPRIDSYMSSQDVRFTIQEIRPFLKNIFETFPVVEAVGFVVVTYRTDEITQKEDAYIEEFRIVERSDIIRQ